MTVGGNGDAMTQPMPAAVIGMCFVNKYYNLLASNPANLHKFYKDESVFSRGVEGQSTDDIVHAVGQSEIHSEIMGTVGKFTKDACRAEIVDVESQESHQGGVMVLVTGYVKYSNALHKRHFTQTFFLDKQTEPYNGYFVLNDILRYLTPAATEGPVPQQNGSQTQTPIQKVNDSGPDFEKQINHERWLVGEKDKRIQQLEEQLSRSMRLQAQVAASNPPALAAPPNDARVAQQRRVLEVVGAAAAETARGDKKYSPRTESHITKLTGVLDFYGYTRSDIAALARRCNYD